MYSITKKAIILGIILVILPTAVIAKNINKESEKVCLAKAIYHESKSEPLHGKKSVAKVVLNRKHHEKFPKTICSVINQVAVVHGRKYYQFSWVPTQHKVKVNKKLWETSLDLSDDILNNKTKLPNFGPNVLYFKSVHSRVRFGKGYRLVQRVGKQNFYEKNNI